MNRVGFIASTLLVVLALMSSMLFVVDQRQFGVLYALGHPILPGTSAYKNDGTDSDFDQRGGDHHDGMEWFSLDNSTSRGLIAMNHEATTDEKLSSFFLHADGEGGRLQAHVKRSTR